MERRSGRNYNGTAAQHKTRPIEVLDRSVESIAPVEIVALELRFAL
jgi:hypothetical protein